MRKYLLAYLLTYCVGPVEFQLKRRARFKVFFTPYPAPCGAAPRGTAPHSVWKRRRVAPYRTVPCWIRCERISTFFSPATCRWYNCIQTWTCRNAVPSRPKALYSLNPFTVFQNTIFVSSSSFTDFRFIRSRNWNYNLIVIVLTFVCRGDRIQKAGVECDAWSWEQWTHSVLGYWTT